MYILLLFFILYILSNTFYLHKKTQNVQDNVSSIIDKSECYPSHKTINNTNIRYITMQMSLICHLLFNANPLMLNFFDMPALLKAQVSLQLGKVFSSDNGLSVSIMYSYMY